MCVCVSRTRGSSSSSSYKNPRSNSSLPHRDATQSDWIFEFVFFFFLFLFYHLKMHRPAVAYFSSLFFIVLFVLFFLRYDTWPTCSPWWQREEKQEINDQRAAHAIGKCRTFRYINRRIEFNSNNPAPHFQKQKTATTWTTICVRGLKFFFFFFLAQLSRIIGTL